MDPHSVGVQPQMASKVRPYSSTALACCPLHPRQTLHGPALSWPAVTAGVKGFHPRTVAHASSAVQTSIHHLDIQEKMAAPRITTRRVLVRMSIPMRVQFGEVLKVVGSGDEFGSWVAARAPRFEWTEGDVWVGNMLMDPGLYEFKVVVFNERTQALRWETSANRVLEVPPGPGTLTLSAHWNAPSTQGWFEQGLPDLGVRLSSPTMMPAAHHPTVGSVLLPGGDASAATLLSRGWDAMLRRGGAGGAAGHDAETSQNANGSSKSASKSSSSSTNSSSSSSRWKAMGVQGNGVGSSSSTDASRSASSSSSSSSTAPATDKDRALLVEGMRGLLKSLSADKLDSSSSFLRKGSTSSSSTSSSSSPSSSASSSSKPAAFSREAFSSSSGGSRPTLAPERRTTPAPSRAMATHSQPSHRSTSSSHTTTSTPTDTSPKASSSRHQQGSASLGTDAAASPMHRYTPRPGGSSPTLSRDSSSGRQWGFDASSSSGWWGGRLALPNLVVGEEVDVKSMTDVQKMAKGLAGMLGKGAGSVSQASHALLEEGMQQLAEGMQQLKQVDREALLNNLWHAVNQLANSETAAAARSSSTASSGSSSTRTSSSIISPVVATCGQVMQAVGNIVTTKSPSAMRGGDAADFIEMSEGYRKKPPLPAAGLTTRRTPLKREEAVRALVERAAKVRAAKGQGASPATLSAALGVDPSTAAVHSSTKGPHASHSLGPTNPEQLQQQHGKDQASLLKQQVWEDPFGAGGAALVAGVVLALLGTEQHGIRQAVGARLTHVTQALIAPVGVEAASSSSNKQAAARARTPTPASRSSSTSSTTTAKPASSTTTAKPASSTTTAKPASSTTTAKPVSAAQKTNVS